MRVFRTALPKDAGEDGDGGDRHRRAHVHRGQRQRDLRREEAAVVAETPGQGAAEDEGNDDAGSGDEAGAAQASANDGGVEFEADHEHVEHESELADRVEDRHARLRKEPRLRTGRERAEERGAEENAGDHLADHLRLAGETAEPADHAAHHEDHGELQDEPEHDRNWASGNDRSIGRVTLWR
jgi:hypothetical protein